MNDEERARAAMVKLEREWEAGSKQTEVQKALAGPKEAADALARAMLKEFWQRGKRFC